MINLEYILEKYDKILLISQMDTEFQWFLEEFYLSEELRKTERNVLILSTKKLESKGKCSCYRISTDEEEALKKFYFLYEFSDKFQLLSREESFGGVINYIGNGILTKEEVFRSILY